MNNLLVVAGALALLALGVVQRRRGLARNPAPLDAVLTAIEEGALAVDVRSADAFREDHYPGAINLPLEDLSRRMRELTDQERTIILYCESGYSSGLAQRLLARRTSHPVLNAGGLNRLRGQ
ncbi:phage shock protein E [Alkalispirochaeta americana]|uniref:Phage shock protein E n=1 Tax=Alkalispirochaeta americana TaxID=159291 RepID=A0A1N6V9E6_9SPIO|nr:rhodanese-like domain-containing protein [Alkalispirochaeta americana]SIQ74455.1 phage shock protein E [Alkalispirochaeta americana]